MKRKITAGSTSVQLAIFVQSTASTTGAGLGSLAHNTAGLVAEYRRAGQSSWTAITLIAGTLGTYASGGFVADGALDGAYEFDPPDAAFASGASFVLLRLRGAANMLPVLIEVELDVVDYQTARFGAAAAGAAMTLTAGANDAIWAVSSRTLTSFGTLITDISNSVWTAATRTLTAVSDSSGITTLLTRIVGTLASGTHNPQSGDSFARLGTPTGASIAADIQTRLPTSSYTTPPTTSQIAAAVDVALINTGDGADLLQAIANQIANDWVAGDASPLAVVSALTANPTFIQLVSDAAAAKTAAQAVRATTDAIGATGSGLTAIPWNAAWDAEVQSECTDALETYDPPTNAEMIARSLPSSSYATATELAKTFKTGETQQHVKVSDNGINTVVATVTRV